MSYRGLDEKPGRGSLIGPIIHSLMPGAKSTRPALRDAAPGRKSRRRGVAQQLGAVGQRRGIPSLRGQRHHPGSGIEIEEGSQDRRSADAIEDGVMHLGDQRRALAFEVVEALAKTQ